VTLRTLYIVVLLLLRLVVGKDHYINDPDFRYGVAQPPVAIYRLIGNDMPPLQMRGQLRWNTQYALNNEKLFQGGTKRWILNRIWNETEFELIYGALIRAGVHRRDIVARCFDIDEYMKQPTVEDKLFYLTSQNEARNEGIMDGRNSGFEWSVILDGNTFITPDSWRALLHGLVVASEAKKQYLKIPYHRVHVEQSTSWLNSSTDMATVLKFAPTKGESQIAFHKSAKELFTLGDTNLENKLKGTATSSKGYGQRNKSYMFKWGQLCGADSKICACASYKDRNEQHMEALTDEAKLEYATNCGLVLRLWNYPSENVISTGLTAEDEKGFFCYLEDARNSIPHGTECDLVNRAIVIWQGLDLAHHRIYYPKAAACKAAYATAFLTHSCFRSEDREIAQNTTDLYLEKLGRAPKSDRVPLCQRLRLASTHPSRKHYLLVYFNATLEAEKKAWMNRLSPDHDKLNPLVEKLIQMAERSLKLGPYSVLQKKLVPKATKDKRFYFSVRPYFWPIESCPPDIQAGIKDGKIKIDPWLVGTGFLHRDGIRLPGTIIGAEHDDNYDRATAWYMVDNVTTLALAWHFTGDKKYSDYGATLVRTFFLDPVKGMYPSLEHAQDGDRTGLIDWKDFYYLTDAFTLLERSGSLTARDVAALQIWCATLAEWLMNSKQGHEEGRSFNNHALYADITVLALATYAHEDNLVDVIRSRLHYRLSRPYPLGHFALDGSQPHETKRPTSLHYITFNMVGWVHVALMIEAIRENSELPLSMQSLLSVTHEGDPTGEPVLIKAIRWFANWLPPVAAYYEKWSEPQDGMYVSYPYKQTDEYAFDRMLEIIQFGVGAYGVKRLFGDKIPAAIQVALFYPRYSTKRATMTAYSSVDPDSGSKAWPGLGVYDQSKALTPATPQAPGSHKET
jgi:Alginate lyase